MSIVDQELGTEDGPYFLGWGFSLVDCVFAPFLERIVASIPYYKVPHFDMVSLCRSVPLIHFHSLMLLVASACGDEQILVLHQITGIVERI